MKKSKTKTITLGGYLRKTLLLVVPATVVISFISGGIMNLSADKMLVHIACNFILGILLVLLVSTKNYKRYMSPSLKIINTLREIVRDSDLTKRMSNEINGEMGDVREYFNQFVVKIQDIMTNIQRTTVTLNESSRELLHAADVMAQASSEINTKTDVVNTTVEEITESIGEAAAALSDSSASMDTVSMSVEEMSFTIRNLAETADRTSSMVAQVAAFVAQISGNINNTSNSAKDVSLSVNSVATAVKEINYSLNEISKNCERSIHITANAGENAKNTNNMIEKLNDSSRQIGKIIGVINEIADQTNMLALNAAIEAAGAGEAGKGFAVVANEVKELAKQTAEATDEIGEQIETMQVNMSGAVKAMESITEVINEITMITGTIASAVTEQSATTGNISKAVITAAGEVSHITREIGEIAVNSQNVMKNLSDATSGVSEMASSSSGLSSAFLSIADSIETTAGKVKEVSRRIHSVSGGTREISQNIQEISVATGEAAADSAVSNNSAKGLLVIAQRMETLVRQFRI